MRTTSYLLLGCILVGSVLGWPLLPDRIPGHFGIDGQVTRWTERTALHWFLLPAIALLVALPAIWLARALPGRPHLANLSDRRFLALGAEHRMPVVERIQHAVYGVLSLVLSLIGLVQVGVYRTAQGFDTRHFMMGVLGLSLIIVPVVLFLWLPGIHGEIERQWRAQHGDQRPPR
jgi:uncharacterized membrane protein